MGIWETGTPNESRPSFIHTALVTRNCNHALRDETACYQINVLVIEVSAG